MLACAVMAGSGIYVEISMRGTVDEIWRLTQNPEYHQRWDLRFSSIRYLRRASESEPQRFHYSTRLGFGLQIDGEGESNGTRENTTGERTSALKFRSNDPKSLISEGSGYWRYIRAGDRTRFITWYDYQTRFGAAGRLFDRILFRPLIGWATSWSFDRLRLWIDRGVDPGTAFRMTVVHATARLAIAFTWLWQGLMPKLLFNDIDERQMIEGAGLALRWLPLLGVSELVLAAAAVGFWRWRPFFLLNLVIMLAALGAVAMQSPHYLVAAFNPVTLNVGMIALSLIGYLAAVDTPSASNCLRRPPV
jgi:DoxX-like family